MSVLPLLVAPTFLAFVFGLVVVAFYTARDHTLKKTADSRIAELIRHMLGVYTRGA